MTLKLPNFLIAGAAKCGTSSFYYYLRKHPQIYMSSIKEPHYFSSQNVDLNYKGRGDDKRPLIKDFEDYCRLFLNVTDEIAIGEASADTLSTYQTSIPAIKDKLTDPRIIIILRNPVDRAYSAYLHLIRENREYLSFEDGLKMEEERIKNNWHGLWYYVQRGMYSHQVKPFMDEFSKVKVFLTEDLNKDPQEIVRQTCEFLSVDPGYIPPYVNVRFNVSGVPRSRALNNLFLMKNPVQMTVRKMAHRIFTEDGWIAIRDSMHAKLMVKPKMRPETRETLKKVFREDILKLQDLLGMDLSVWLNK